MDFEEKLRRVIKSLPVQILLILLAITGFNALTVWQMIGDLRLFSEVTLFLIALLFVLLYIRERKKASFEPSQKTLISRVGEIPWLSASLRAFKAIEDDIHKITRLTCLYGVNFTNGGNLIVKRRYKGMMVGKDPSIEFRTYGGGDNPISDDKFKATLRAFDHRHRQKRELNTEILKGVSTELIKVFKVIFTNPLKVDDPFDFEIEYTWPGCLSRNPDGIFFRFNHLKKGINRLAITISSPVRFKNWSMEKLIKRKGIEYSTSDGVKRAFEKIPKKGQFNYHWSKHNPMDEFVFVFER